MPKKNPPNAFFYFMLDRKAAYERNGERFPNGLADVSAIAGPEWEVLPEAQKKKYHEMARKEKDRLKNNPSRKLTNQHNSFDHNEKARAELEEQIRTMNKYIEMTISTLCSTNKIKEFKFYLIHANYFCVSEPSCYHPAEVAVCEFSLLEGVTKVYHTITIFGHIPLGLLHEAKDRCNNVHRIPHEFEDGEKSAYTVWNNIKDILERGRSTHGGAYPPMYTMPDKVHLNTSISCVRSIIKTMCDASGDYLEDFPVFPLEKLFYELRNKCAIIEGGEDQALFFPSVPYANTILENDIYNYTEEIACLFHQNEDHVTNCSKSFVQRWAFIICDQVCASVNIKVVPGKHLPPNAKVEDKHYSQSRNLKVETAPPKVVPKVFTMVGPSGEAIQYAPIEMERKPLAAPRVQPSVVRPMARPPQNTESFDDDFPNLQDLSDTLVIGRGRGRFPRGGRGAGGSSQLGTGRGSGPMSFAAAARGGRGR